MTRFSFTMPDWAGNPPVSGDDDVRMRWVVSLAQTNIRHGGGPFAAAVFDGQGKLVAAGVNRVVSERCSVLHAEMVALMLAQKKLGRYDLSDGGQQCLELFSSTEPCAMCLGALPWSGIRRLVCAARDEDARAAGFDEGDKPQPWWAGLERRGIEVVRDLCRDEARTVLRDYAAGGGEIYNG